MTNNKYILIDHRPVICDDLLMWGDWFENAREDRRVALTTVSPGRHVSTIFLGLDHNLSNTGPPILFETAATNDGHFTIIGRYATWEEAEAGHHRAVEALRQELGVN